MKQVVIQMTVDVMMPDDFRLRPDNYYKIEAKYNGVQAAVRQAQISMKEPKQAKRKVK